MGKQTVFEVHLPNIQPQGPGHTSNYGLSDYLS